MAPVAPVPTAAAVSPAAAAPAPAAPAAGLLDFSLDFSAYGAAPVPAAPAATPEALRARIEALVEAGMEPNAAAAAALREMAGQGR